MTNGPAAALGFPLVIRAWSFLRHYGFVIRHSIPFATMILLPVPPGWVVVVASRYFPLAIVRQRGETLFIAARL